MYRLNKAGCFKFLGKVGVQSLYRFLYILTMNTDDACIVTLYFIKEYRRCLYSYIIFYKGGSSIEFVGKKNTYVKRS